ncbi:hypothetical protein [Phytohabitans houttuyneae]|uniref:Uncharacterized protein n=1 Tax=Phytohabitans houttuyneae TaxID=1076126 RepID=A0A6V8KKA9_9ACTN|nr:hypothetical protein [Phytohabitans houttuyneae]GFJ82609.1 hypothetical protein Phou_067890 [Phytohabitans houttuyneae]
MRDIADLGRAMARETADLAPRASAEEILRGGRRRAHRRTVAAAAGATVMAVALPVAVLSTGGGDGDSMPVGGSPPPTPTPSVELLDVTPAGPVPDPTLLTPGPTRTPLDPSVGCPTDAQNAQVVGDSIWTGATNSAGKELMVRFVRDDEADPAKAGFAVGLGDRVTGQVESLGCSFMFALPPAAEGYPAISAEFDGPVFPGPDATTTIVGSFIGPVDRITATYDGTPLTVGWKRWSAHPELVVYWITGVPAGADVNPRDAAHPLIKIYDAAGKVIGPPAE